MSEREQTDDWYEEDVIREAIERAREAHFLNIADQGPVDAARKSRDKIHREKVRLSVRHKTASAELLDARANALLEGGETPSSIDQLAAEVADIEARLPVLAAAYDLAHRKVERASSAWAKASVGRLSSFINLPTVLHRLAEQKLKDALDLIDDACSDIVGASTVSRHFVKDASLIPYDARNFTMFNLRAFIQEIYGAVPRHLRSYIRSADSITATGNKFGRGIIERVEKPSADALVDEVV